MFENVLDMLPVLHEQGISLIDNHEFDGTQEVVVLLLGAVSKSI